MLNREGIILANEKIPTVTVIIPMYNMEKYIEECLQSLLNQTLKNFEVIVVDDVSTDKSLAVAEKMIPAFEEKNLQLSTITLTQNSGCPGIPRNVAMDFAKGKYIYFLDSDDFLDETALEDFYKVAEEFKADVVHSEKCFVYEKINGEMTDSISSTQTGEFVEKPTLETMDIGQRINDFTNKRYLWWGCNKLFSRKFLTENNIKFSNMTAFEDLIFTFQCVICAKKYVRVPFVNYHYRIRENSLSHQGIDGIGHSLNMFEGVRILDDFMNGKKFFQKNLKYRYAVLDFVVQDILDMVSENFFVLSNLDPAEVFDYFAKGIFSKDPDKNVALTSYLFTTMNIYKLFVKQQAAEIVRLKKILQNK